MDITGRLQQLEELVAEAKSMPLSTSVLVNREEVLELIQEMRASLPEEIKQARWVVKDREQLLT
ncbi:MAG: ATPase, partial [Actinomycetota bacterium]